MATVKIICPQCFGFGLIGNVLPTRCTQCSGTGTISQDDSQTLANLNTAAAISGVPIVKTTTPIPPAAAVKAASKGK